MRCVEFVEQVSDWLEGGLADDERVLVEEHLSFCQPCGRYLEQFRAALLVVHLAGEQLGEAPPAPVRTALLEAFRQRHH
jgi:hypothetical protein